MEYFEELLNRPAPKEPVNIQPAVTTWRSSVLCLQKTKFGKQSYISKWQSSSTLRHPVRGTKSGHRYICGDALPALCDDLGENEVPTQIGRRDIASSFQKGDLSMCSLLSIPGKVFNIILLNRLKDAVDPHLRNHQAGFRKNQSCAGQIVTLRITRHFTSIFRQNVAGWRFALLL